MALIYCFADFEISVSSLVIPFVLLFQSSSTCAAFCSPFLQTFEAFSSSHGVVLRTWGVAGCGDFFCGFYICACAPSVSDLRTPFFGVSFLHTLRWLWSMSLACPRSQDVGNGRRHCHPFHFHLFIAGCGFSSPLPSLSFGVCRVARCLCSLPAALQAVRASDAAYLARVRAAA